MKTILITTFAFMLCAFTLTPTSFAQNSFNEWRGKGGVGHADAKNLPVKWNATTGIAWAAPVEGLGWSTPIVGDGKVWITSGIQTPASAEEQARRRKLTTNSQPLIISKHVSLRAVCFDLSTGKELHNIEVLAVDDPQIIHRTNSYATPTPILEGEMLYCHFGALGMIGLNTKSLQVVWSNTNLSVKLENGPGSSPVLWNNLLILHCDGIDQQYIVALDKKTGKIAWKTERSGALNDNPQLRKSYCTPVVVEINGNDQIVSPSADWVYGYDPESGKELWKHHYGQLGFSNAARPVIGNGLVFVTTGYMKAAMLALDIQTAGSQQKAVVKWRFDRQVPNVSSPVVVGNEIYFSSDNGIVTCLDSRTGDEHWVHRMGARFWASPLYADGKIYFFERDGVTTVIEPGVKYTELGKNELGGTLFASPSAVDGKLLIRTDKMLYCIGK